jgi:hypothetical protein
VTRDKFEPYYAHSMTHRGLEAAVGAAGGVTGLARRAGVSQPSIYNLLRIPSEHVLAVEAATGIARAILRPDLHAAGPQPSDDPDATLLKRVTRHHGDETPLGRSPMRRISGEFRAPLGQQQQIRDKHLAPWLGRFFADLGGRRRPGSTARSVRSGDFSSRSKQKHSRYRAKDGAVGDGAQDEPDNP